MKGQNNFMVFLVAALILLAVLMLIFGAQINKNQQQNQARAIEVVKIFTIPQLDAANMLETQSTDAIDKRVFSGLLFGEDKIIYDLRKTGLQSVSVHFVVSGANGLAPLAIKSNGVVVQEIFAPGTYDVQIPAEAIANNTLIEVAADSSLWKIWAPNIYDLRDVYISYSSYAQSASQFKFALGDELRTMEFAKVDLALTDNVGPLIVDLNGRTIWNAPVADLQSITLDRSDLQLGDNIIKFRGAQNSRFAGNGTIAIIFLAPFPFPQSFNESGVVVATQPLIGSTNQFFV